MIPRPLLASSIVLAACGGARATGPAENRGVAGGGCLPADLTSKDGVYRLVTAGGRTHICGAHVTDDGASGPRGCWTVDLVSGAVGPSELVEDEVRTDVTARLGDGVNIQIVGADGTVVREIPYHTNADNGPSAAAMDARIIGDVVFVDDFDAGPHADVHMWRLDGTVLGPVRDPDDRREYGGEFERYNGTESVLSAHEVAFAEYLLTRVIVIDTRTMRTTTWTRALPDVPGCSAENVDQFLSPIEDDFADALEEGRMTRACLDALHAVHARFRSGSIARAPGGELVALTQDAHGATLIYLGDGGRLAREVPLPVCKM